MAQVFSVKTCAIFYSLYETDTAFSVSIESFVEIPDVSMRDAIEFVISNHTLYIIGCDCAYQEEDGSWTEMSRIGDQYLYAINLDTADVKNYGLINDAPTASYNWTLNGAMFADVELTGIYQNKLYLSYRYVDDLNDIIDYVNNGNSDNPDWSDVTKVGRKKEITVTFRDGTEIKA